MKTLNWARREHSVVASSTQEIYGLRTGTDGSEYLEMEWVDGKTLEEYGYCNGDFLSEVFFDTATVLDAFTKVGLVHRDIKSSHIVVQYNRRNEIRVKLLDCFLLRGFGFNEGTEWDRMGTPAYAAPEQMRDDGYVGCTTDVYALGIIVWEKTSGKTARVPNYNCSFEKRFPELVKSGWRKIVEGCTRVDDRKRWSVYGILDYLKKWRILY